MELVLYYFCNRSKLLITSYIPSECSLCVDIFILSAVVTTEAVIENGCSSSGEMNGSDTQNSVASDTALPDPAAISPQVPETTASENSPASVPVLQEDTGQDDSSAVPIDRRSDSVASNPPLTPTSITRVPSQVEFLFHQGECFLFPSEIKIKNLLSFFSLNAFWMG